MASIVIAAAVVAIVVMVILLGLSVDWLLAHIWTYPRVVDAVNYAVAGALIYWNWDN